MGGDANQSLILGEALDSEGNLIGSSRLTGHDMYQYTGDIMAWMAEKISKGEIEQYGVVGPVRAFGLKALKQGHKEIGFKLSTKLFD